MRLSARSRVSSSTSSSSPTTVATRWSGASRAVATRSRTPAAAASREGRTGSSRRLEGHDRRGLRPVHLRGRRLHRIRRRARRLQVGSDSTASNSVFTGGGLIDSVSSRAGSGSSSAADLAQQNALFVCLKELPNNKFGTQSEIYWDDAFLNTQVGALTRGTYTLRITDPLTFIRNFVPAGSSADAVSSTSPTWTTPRASSCSTKWSARWHRRSRCTPTTPPRGTASRAFSRTRSGSPSHCRRRSSRTTSGGRVAASRSPRPRSSRSSTTPTPASCSRTSSAPTPCQVLAATPTCRPRSRLVSSLRARTPVPAV